MLINTSTTKAIRETEAFGKCAVEKAGLLSGDHVPPCQLTGIFLRSSLLVGFI